MQKFGGKQNRDWCVFQMTADFSAVGGASALRRSLSAYAICCLALTVGCGSTHHALSAAPAGGALQSPAVVSSDFTFDAAPYPSCHASTIVEIAPGKLAAAWFGGTRERAPDVCIWVAIDENGKWQEQKNVANGIQADGTKLPTWNPVLFQAPGGPLFLFYKVGPSPKEWWGEVKTSTDGGATWGEARQLPSGVLGPIKNKPVILADGSWLAGSSTEGSGWRVHFERSTDAGKTWTIIGPVGAVDEKGKPKINAIQPSLLTYADGRLQAICRTSGGVLATTWSKDNGQTWSDMAAMNLPNPNSGTDAVTLADGRQLLVYNNSAPPPDRPTKGLRYPIDVAISSDGIEWKHVLTLDSKPIGQGYAYPAVIQTSDGLVHITYTFDRRRIKHVVIDPKKL